MSRNSNNSNNNNCFISVAVQWPTVKFESHWMRSTLSYDRKGKETKTLDSWARIWIHSFIHLRYSHDSRVCRQMRITQLCKSLPSYIFIYPSSSISLSLSLVSLGRANFHKRHEAPNFQKKTFHFGQQIFSFCLSFFSLFPLLSFSVTGANIIF